jgi:hypothetical protein
MSQLIAGGRKQATNKVSPKLNKNMGSQPLGIVLYELPEYSGNPSVTSFEEERAFERAIRARKIKEQQDAEQPERSAPFVPVEKPVDTFDAWLTRREQEFQAA